LREPRSGAKRADAVIVSKCPAALSEVEQTEIKNRISRYTRPKTPVYFTKYHYGKMVGFGSKKVPSKNIVLVTGIANPEPLIRYLEQQNYQILAQLTFPDHHAYTQTDLLRIGKTMENLNIPDAMVLTTRKDAVKLLAPALKQLVSGLPFFYLPIEVTFLAGQQEFDAQVRRQVADRFR